MKKKKTIISLFLCILALTSCDFVHLKQAQLNGPWIYQEDIEDYVTFEIAFLNTIIEGANDLSSLSYTTNYFDESGLISDYMMDQWSEQIDGFEEDVLERWEGDVTFLDILNVFSKQNNYKYQHIAVQVLDEYKRTNAVLSDYVQVSTSSQKQVWKVKELRTNLVFWIIIGENQWNIEIDESSMELYIRRNI